MRVELTEQFAAMIKNNFILTLVTKDSFLSWRAFTYKAVRRTDAG
jgi:hypothetical protein